MTCDGFLARISVFAQSAVKAVAILTIIIGSLRPDAAAQAPGLSRSFAYTYEAEVLPQDALQFRQWVTWKSDKGMDSVYDYFGFRHELAYGLTDDWQASLFLSDWYYEKADAGTNQDTKWQAVAAQTMYVLSDPAADLIGSALNGEVAVGNDFLKLQGRLVLQMDLDAFTFAYNAALAAQWDNSQEPTDQGEIEQTLGVNCQVHPNFALGLELLNQIEIEGWSDSDDPLIYLGPVLAAQNNGWWVTLAPLFQTTNVDTEVDFQVRLLAGLDL